MSSKVSTTPKPSKKICILPFLRGLLEDPSMTNIICWTNKEKQEFKMVDHNKVAELWGATKPGRKVKVMTYGNMARVLREQKLLEKIHGKTCEYRFVKPLVFGIDRILSPYFGRQVSRPQSTSIPGASSSSGTPSPIAPPISGNVSFQWTLTPAQQMAQFSAFIQQYLQKKNDVTTPNSSKLSVR